VRHSADAGFALELARIPRASARKGENSVGNAVECVTGGEHGLLDQRHLRGQQVVFGFRVEGLHAQNRVRVDERRVDRRARDHAVVVVGIALNLREALAAAGRAALEIGVARSAAVQLGRHVLAHHDSEMRGAMAEVDDALDVARTGGVERERRIDASALGCPRSFWTTA
jgi:hypothetical protein